MKQHAKIPDCTGGVCPVETTLNLISGKWKGIIVFRLLGGKKRFGELKKIMPAVTFRTLTLQLRQLEADGIVQRTVYAEVPPRVEYALTDLGKSMEPIIQAMFDWGVEYQRQEKQWNKNEHNNLSRAEILSADDADAACRRETCYHLHVKSQWPYRIYTP